MYVAGVPRPVNPWVIGSSENSKVDRRAIYGLGPGFMVWSLVLTRLPRLYGKALSLWPLCFEFFSPMARRCSQTRRNRSFPVDVLRPSDKMRTPCLSISLTPVCMAPARASTYEVLPLLINDDLLFYPRYRVRAQHRLDACLSSTYPSKHGPKTRTEDTGFLRRGPGFGSDANPGLQVRNQSQVRLTNHGGVLKQVSGG